MGEEHLWPFHTVWTRLEPRSRNEDLDESVRAGVRDPLWMLSRQWQVGELALEDAGSPIAARLSVEHDRLARVRLGEEGPVLGYDPDSDGPLEALVEREPVLADDDPPARARVEAGLHFLRLLDRHLDGDGYAASDFPEDLLLSDLEGPLAEEGRGFVRAVEGRALDGLEVYRRVAGAAETGWTGGDPPLPDGLSADDPGYRDAATAYLEWYRDCYDEPTADAGDAWDPERLEYRVAVATGDGDAETVFEAEEYPGGRLDWYDFSKDAEESLAAQAAAGDRDGGGGDGDGGDGDGGDGASGDGDGSEASESRVVERMPTNVTYPGMPAARWWEFENAAVNLDAVAASPEDPVRLLALEFAGLYGNDWFSMPVDVPVGSLTRVADVTVVDTFGVRTGADPIRPPAEHVPLEEQWNLFAFPGTRRSGDDREAPGLFVPPVLGDHQRSDPIERVLFARDEMANLVFATEQQVEGADGRPVDRREHLPAGLAVRSIHPHGAPEEETLVLANPGSEPLDVGGWTVSDGGSVGAEYEFDAPFVVPPLGTVRLHTGGDPAADRMTDVHWGLPFPVWEDATEAVVTDADGDTVIREPVPGSDDDAMPDYLLATSVPDHWYPFKPVQTDPSAGAYRLEFALLLDADSLDAGRSDLPVPHGELLEPYADPSGGDEPPRLYDEEVTRAGVEVTRAYQRARWSDGATYVWSGRRAAPGRGEGSSGLLFDVLDAP